MGETHEQEQAFDTASVRESLLPQLMDLADTLDMETQKPSFFGGSFPPQPWVFPVVSFGNALCT